MNKFTKLILTSAIISTSGFATQQLGGMISGVGQINQGANLEMEAGVKANMDRQAVIHNYGTIQGPAATAEDGTEITAETVVGDGNKDTISDLADGSKAVISGTSAEKIINYDHIMEEDTAFAGLEGVEVTGPTYFRPTGRGKIQGAVDTTDVTVTSAMADLIHAIDIHNEGTDVMLLTSTYTEEEKTMTLTNSAEKQVIVKANIANEVATGGESNSHSLVVRGAFRFEGDQSRFNQTDTTLKFKKSHSEIGTSKSLFMTPIDVEEESKLVIDAAGVEMPHDVTITNSKFIVNPNASFTLKPGARLLFKYTEGVLTISYPSEKPTQMTWNVGDFTGELSAVYYYSAFNESISCPFWKEGGEWKTDDNSISITEEKDTLIFSNASNGKTSEVLLSDLNKERTKDNPVKWNGYHTFYDETTGTSDIQYYNTLYFDYYTDNLFSYDWNAENDSWTRRFQVLAFEPNGIDPTTLITKESRLIINTGSGEEQLYAMYMKGGCCTIEDVRHVASQENVINTYSGGGQRLEGNCTTGFYAQYSVFNQAIISALESGEKWMTLEEYNAKNGTSYTWA